MKIYVVEHYRNSPAFGRYKCRLHTRQSSGQDAMNELARIYPNAECPKVVLVYSELFEDIVRNQCGKIRSLIARGQQQLALQRCVRLWDCIDRDSYPEHYWNIMKTELPMFVGVIL